MLSGETVSLSMDLGLFESILLAGKTGAKRSSKIKIGKAKSFVPPSYLWTQDASLSSVNNNVHTQPSA